MALGQPALEYQALLSAIPTGEEHALVQSFPPREGEEADRGRGNAGIAVAVEGRAVRQEVFGGLAADRGQVQRGLREDGGRSGGTVEETLLAYG